MVSGFATAAAACTFVMNADRIQCVSNKDCAGRGLPANARCQVGVCVVPPPVIQDSATIDVPDAPLDPTWGCLGNMPPVPFPDKSTPVHFRARFEGLLTQLPLDALPVKACTLLDLGCAQPVDGPRDTDAEGVIDMVVHHGFRGYLDIGATEAHSDLMPSLLYALPVPNKTVAPQDPPPVWNLLTKNEFEFAAGSVGKTLNPSFGHLFFAAVDCQGITAVGATLQAETITAETFTYYTDAQGTPSITQARTSQSGNGGFLNLPVGTVTVRLSREDGELIGSHNVIIRAGSITYMLFGPTPR
ncbi:MAG TPA: hypothetical protein VM925_20135 [Labilithrix sp.]|nr:hypothetical protein [Labilithrix sp.]